MSSDERMAILVHEVRSPVAALAAVAEALREMDRRAVARGELVRLAIGACGAIERIVTDIAVASVRLSTVDPSDLVRSAVAAHVVGGADVSARVGVAVPSIAGDPVRLRQALDNLVTNAVTHGGGSVVIGAAYGDDVVAFSVADSGDGIPQDDLARIFEPGIRLDTRRPGSGLGLAITRAIVEAHGGTISVESSSAGTTFTIALPAAQPQPAT